MNTQILKVRIMLLLALSSASVCTSAQQLGSTEKTNEEIFTARVKQFWEFADRFNLVTDFQGKQADSAFIRKMPREKMLNALFNLKDPRAMKQNASYIESFVQTRNDFIRDVTQGKILLDKHSPGIIAEARSKITVNGRPKTVSIFLVQEVSPNRNIKWVMLSVMNFPDNTFISDTTMVRFISPNSNETAFLNLGRALEDKDHLQSYAYTGFKPDNLSIFLYCVNAGIVKFEYAEEVIYHVISIPGWYFKVQDYNRNELNSGWLISDLQKGNFNREMFR